jgi:purine-binding chemotaxis protein CheW
MVVGVMALRDQLLPLLSLRGLLGHTNAVDGGGREKIFVTSVGGAPVGLIADRARAIVSADRRLVDPIPSMLAVRTGGEARIKAIYRGEGGRRLISILSPEQLFREDVMQRLATAHRPAAALGADSQQSDRSEASFLVFRLGDDEFGLPVEAVDEVAQVPDQITRVPKAPKFLEGLVNLRGDIVPVIDQRRRFGMPRLKDASGRRLIVVRSQGHRAALIVDAVSEVLRSSADAVEATPSLTDEAARLVSGVINLGDEDRIVLVLDPTELLTQAERRQLDAFASDDPPARR